MKTCTSEQALEILRDPTVLKCLSFYPEGIKAVQTYLVGNALLIVMPQGDEAEVHLACKLRDRAELGNKLKEAREELRKAGFKRVWTTAPDSRKALVRMLIKLGFVKKELRWVWE